MTSFTSLKSFEKMLKKSIIGASILIIQSSRYFVTEHSDVRMFADQSGVAK